MTLFPFTPLAPLFTSGVLALRDGAVDIDQTRFLRLSEDEQHTALRKLFLHLTRNAGDREITSQVKNWATRPVVHADETEKRKFLGRLEAELRRIGIAETPPPAAAPSAPAAAVETVPPLRRGYPEIWDSLPPAARIQVIRKAIAQNLLDKIQSYQTHAALLTEQTADWLRAPNEKNLIAAHALLARMNRETPGSPLHSFFWEGIHENSEVGATLQTWLREDSIERRKILRECVVGLILHVTEPLTNLPPLVSPLDQHSPAGVLHPKWRTQFTRATRKFLSEIAASHLGPSASLDDSARHGRFLAQALVSCSRYPLSLAPQDIGRVAHKMMGKELPLLREILVFVSQEAMAEKPDWPFLRAFWQKLSEELKGKQPKEALAALVMFLMVHGISEAHRPKKT